MPIYEYNCSSCDHNFEVLQKIKDEPIQECENCGEPKAKRQISRSSFVLKGSGWYVTDYGGKTPPKSTKTETTKSETTKSEATPAS